MEHGLSIAILAGLGGMFGWGLADFFGKKTIDKIGDISTLTWGHIFGSATFLIFLLYHYLTLATQIELPANSDWYWLLFFGFLQAVVYLLIYRGFSKGQVSILSPIFASFAGITAAISIFFIGEQVSSGIYLSLFILFVGILLINLDPKSLILKRITFLKIPGFKEVAIATGLAVIWTLMWNKFMNGKEWLTYTFAMYVFMTVITIIYAKLVKVNLAIKNNSFWKFLIAIGVFEISAYEAITWGYSVTPFTSVVALLSGAFSLPTIFLARIFLKEKISITQIIGCFIIILAIIILSLFQ